MLLRKFAIVHVRAMGYVDSNVGRALAAEASIALKGGRGHRMIARVHEAKLSLVLGQRGRKWRSQQGGVP